LHLSTHRPIRDDSRSSRPFWDIEPGPLVLALRRSRPIQARHLDARTYLARARLAAIALVSARSPPGCSGRSACVHLSATACVPARSPCGARDRARTLHLTVRGPFSVHVRLGAHVCVLTRSPFGDRAHPRSRSPEQRARLCCSLEQHIHARSARAHVHVSCAVIFRCSRTFHARAHPAAFMSALACTIRLSTSHACGARVCAHPSLRSRNVNLFRSSHVAFAAFSKTCSPFDAHILFLAPAPGLRERPSTLALPFSAT